MQIHRFKRLLNTARYSADHSRQPNKTRRTSVKMENFRRQPRSIAEEDQNYGLLQHADNEIIISTSGKINRYVTVGLELLEKNGTIVVVGSGKAVSKTVSVAEIIKRRMDGSLHQYTQIGSSTATEKWDPVEGKDFSQLVVSKHIPVLTIYLCQEASPALEKVSGYQAPTKEVGGSK
ncbi:hypothetical protein K450DRAFT_237462 [Umbelopsis ramanniana AG]|uniref:DNA/RNA-binding protein Alba-like domain-containing protein n=1 Tax=Umbelopsis ramanniana AG TaxID=1314678 RepID=A0AAD5EAS6_UMBRA|nr:uncharacterized protein K450DRAFT_237462 [Umbelopsis ramanniana AG]KAI8580528.1 hypothetical protein K450DRAFT_237462 [Umbelopsis ramanniana AG]